MRMKCLSLMNIKTTRKNPVYLKEFKKEILSKPLFFWKAIKILFQP